MPPLAPFAWRSDGSAEGSSAPALFGAMLGFFLPLLLLLLAGSHEGWFRVSMKWPTIVVAVFTAIGITGFVWQWWWKPTR